MKILILILLFAISLFSKGAWSEPVLVAAPETGVANRNCQVAVDHNGVLHTVFTEDFSSEYANLKYSQSTDDGKTWSPQINITPNNTTERVYEPKIAIDSENNVHIIFYYVSDDNAFYYMNNVGGNWSEPEYLGFHITSIPLIEIDKDDRIYVFFCSGDKSYYIFKDKSGSWNTPSSIPSVENYYVADILSYGSNLYAVGRELIEKKSSALARLFKYDKVTENWTDIIDISNSSALSKAMSLYIKNDTIHIAILDGPTGSDNVTIYIYGGLDLNSWSVPDTIGTNRTFVKQIFVDRENTPNIFETSSTYYNLLRSSNFNNEGWNTEIIVSDSTTYFDNLHVAFCDECEACIVYYYNSNIYFQTKVVTGIENNSHNIINDYRIEQIYPNPFNNQTTILFNLKENANIELYLYNSNGQLVQTILNKKYIKGKHQYILNANSINSGVYYCKMIVDGVFKDSKRVVYLK